MLGNVWEWVADCWHGGYGGAPSTGEVWAGGDCANRALRGGSWVSPVEHHRVSMRPSYGTGSRMPFNGFRCAKDAP